MATRERTAMLFLSVDLPAVKRDSGEGAGNSLAAVLSLLNMPATWITDSSPSLPPQTAAVTHDAAVVTGEEVAAARGDFAAQLRGRIDRLANAGWSASALACADCSRIRHLDVAADLGLRTAIDLGASPQRPTLLRHGVWRAPAAISLRRRRPLFAGRRSPLQALDETIAAGGATHIQVAGERKHVESLLAHAAGRRDEGRLHIARLSDLAEWITTAGRSEPAESILRRAA